MISLPSYAQNNWLLAWQAAAFSSLNGIGLALVLSSVQSVLADIYEPEQRGKAFGIMLTAASVGGHPFQLLHSLQLQLKRT